jgi:putative sugar O-methyltransferase
MTKARSQKQKVQRVIIWGTASGSHDVVIQLLSRGITIDAFVDSNEKKWGTEFHSYPVCSPAYIKEAQYDYIVVASYYTIQITEAINAMGICAEKIIYFNPNEPEKALRYLPRISVFVADCYQRKGTIVERAYKRYNVQGPQVGDVSSPRSEDEQYPLVEKLIDAYVKATDSLPNIEALFHAGTNWQSLLSFHRKDFYDAIKKRDIAYITKRLNNFFRNELSTSIAAGPRAFQRLKDDADDALYSNLFYDFRVWAKSMRKDDLCDMSELGFPPIGNPFGTLIDGAILNDDSFRHHYRAHFIDSLLSRCERPVLAEIGAGYGHCAYYWMKKDGLRAYINFDLPDNLILSSYFLSMAFPEKRILLFSDVDMKLTKDLFKEYDIILMPNYMISKLEDLSVDMFINTVSLSEMEMETIEAYIKNINRVTRFYFYHKNLAHMPNGYKGYPASVFPEPDDFALMSMRPSLWNMWGFRSPFHIYQEYLYQRK